MFSFKKSKEIEITQAARETYLIILNKLMQIIGRANLTAQIQVVQALKDLLSQQKDEEFVKQLNGKDMWGGSGAVWEVHIEDNHSAREFEREMIKLIDLMEKTNVLGKGMKPIRKIFRKNVEEK